MTCISCAVSVKLVTAVEPSADAHASSTGPSIQHMRIKKAAGMCILGWSEAHGKKRKEKTTPFGVNLMRSQVLYRGAQPQAHAGQT